MNFLNFFSSEKPQVRRKQSKSPRKDYRTSVQGQQQLLEAATSFLQLEKNSQGRAKSPSQRKHAQEHKIARSTFQAALQTVRSHISSTSCDLDSIPLSIFDHPQQKLTAAEEEKLEERC